MIILSEFLQVLPMVYSALEMKLYIQRFIHHIGGLPDFSALKFTKYNQYESLILPMQKYLEDAGVEFRFGTQVNNVIFEFEGSKKIARKIECTVNGEEIEIPLTENDLVFVTNGSCTESTIYGDHTHAPIGDAEVRTIGCWQLWKNIAAQDPSFGHPEKFCGDTTRSNWESATVTTADETIIQRITDICHRDPRTGNVVTGGIVSCKDSSWLLSWTINRQGQFKEQDEQTITGFLKAHGFEDEQIEKNLSSFIAAIKGIVLNFTKNVVGETPQVGGNLGNVGLGCILAIYFMLYKKRIVPWIIGICQKIIRKERYQHFVNFCSRCNAILLKYISCTLLDGLFVGVSNAIFMLICRIPYVALISVIVGVTNLLPTFGPLVGGAIGFIILILTKPSYAFLFLVFTIIIQTIDGYIVKPKFFGNTLGVSPLWILIAIICGGKIFGVGGVFLAIPFAAIVQYLLEEILFPKVKEERKHKIHVSTLDDK